MARQVDSAVLIVAALAAFFATFFAVLVLLQPETAAVAQREAAEVSSDPLPEVAAAPPLEIAPEVVATPEPAVVQPVQRYPDEALEVLESLGVKCADGANCSD